MGVMVYRCLHGQAPRYLADHLIRSSDVASRLRLRSANRHQLVVGLPRCRLNTYGRLAFSIAGPTVWNLLPDDCDELRDPAYYALYKSTFYLLTYLLTLVNGGAATRSAHIAGSAIVPLPFSSLPP